MILILLALLFCLESARASTAFAAHAFQSYPTHGKRVSWMPRASRTGNLLAYQKGMGIVVCNTNSFGIQFTSSANASEYIRIVFTSPPLKSPNGNLYPLGVFTTSSLHPERRLLKTTAAFKHANRLPVNTKIPGSLILRLKRIDIGDIGENGDGFSGRATSTGISLSQPSLPGITAFTFADVGAGYVGGTTFNFNANYASNGVVWDNFWMYDSYIYPDVYMRQFDHVQFAAPSTAVITYQTSNGYLSTL